MVCLPLLDVKFNFAVAVGRMGLFKNKYFLCQRGAIADRAIPQLFGGEFTCSRCHEKQIIFVQNRPADKGREFNLPKFSEIIRNYKE
jgi:hypothetical protein